METQTETELETETDTGVETEDKDAGTHPCHPHTFLLNSRALCARSCLILSPLSDTSLILWLRRLILRLILSTPRRSGRPCATLIMAAAIS